MRGNMKLKENGAERNEVEEEKDQQQMQIRDREDRRHKEQRFHLEIDTHTHTHTEYVCVREREIADSWSPAWSRIWWPPGRNSSGTGISREWEGYGHTQKKKFTCYALILSKYLLGSMENFIKQL